VSQGLAGRVRACLSLELSPELPLNSRVRSSTLCTAFCCLSRGMRSRNRRLGPAALVFLATVWLSPLGAAAQSAVIRVPPVKIPLDVKDQPIAITASAILTLSSKDRGQQTLNVQLTGDLSELQRNLTALLSSELDKDDHCADRIAVENATLAVAEPAAVAAVQLHVERWACVKVLGKQVTKKLIGGDAQIRIKLTPQIDDNNTSLRLVPEVEDIQADSSLGEVLRSGALGDTIREKIRSAILSALDKGTNLAAVLPPAVQGYVTIKEAEFKDGGDGRLLAVLDGEARISQEQVHLLTGQLKERVGAGH
jgi:hypothetical protein